MASEGWRIVTRRFLDFTGRRRGTIAVGAVLTAILGLLWHARLYNFVCDDAFITLRFARNLAHHGMPVYNLEERVEGYSNPLWMFLIALGILLGLDPVFATQVLGGFSGALVVISAWKAFRRVEPTGLFGGIFVLVMLALSAPVAAWTLGGLETPLFAALITLGVALCADLAAERRPRHALAAGSILALATLTRPEGALVFVIAGAVVTRTGGYSRTTARAVGLFVAAYILVVGPFELWRWLYYGSPLPNTFYAKVPGDRIGLLRQGLAYGFFAFIDLGVWFCLLVAATLLLPIYRTPAGDESPDSIRRRTLLWCARLIIPSYVGYVIFVGGDFLDLYRFFVPLFPLALVSLTAGRYWLLDLAKRRQSSRLRVFAAVALPTVVIAAHAVTQVYIKRRALVLNEQNRLRYGIEPLGWTRLYARRWAAMGRWIRAHSQPDDWLAVGAAGAMPFYSGLNTLDLLGLCDTFIARHGDPLGNRPGHQRVAPIDYILSKRPTFLFANDQVTYVKPPAPPQDPNWERQGYVWVDIHIDKASGAPKPYYHRLLMRQDRAESLHGDPEVALP